MIDESRLAEIEARADTVTHHRLNAHQCAIIARRACLEDVPALLAEVRRLRNELSYLRACQL